MIQTIFVSPLFLSPISESNSSICFGDPVECFKNGIGVVTQNKTKNICEYETDHDEYDEYEDIDDKIGVRSSYVTGRYCFASDGYPGSCQFSYKCRG